MIFNKQVLCPNCGKKAKKNTEIWWERHYGKYEGNLKVIRREQTFNGDILTLWDGESYKMYCGYFCTNRCAQEFGNAAFHASICADA
tara:strand:- start:256 stop:516 length:261 start_codon:yes stop_codon:yes gene_type:complete